MEVLQRFHVISCHSLFAIFSADTYIYRRRKWAGYEIMTCTLFSVTTKLYREHKTARVAKIHKDLRGELKNHF